MENAAQTTGRGDAEGWLMAIIVIYVLMVLSYFFVWMAGPLKYGITIGGILLGTVVRETASKEWKTLRLVAICVPLLAVAVVQAHDSYTSAQRQKDEEREESRVRARALEASLREQLTPEPWDSIEAIRSADKGFLAKSELLALRARLEGAPAGPDMARLNNLQASYRNAAAEFRQVVKPRYEEMLSLRERSSEGNRQFHARLLAATEIVAGLAAKHRNAGLYNHAGALAQAANDGRRALAHFYQALSLEPDHLPAYESLGYALWIFNEDAFGALRLAKQGLDQCARQREQIGNAKDVGTFASYLDAMESRLKLQYAYFSATQFANETQARQYASEQFRSNPNDAEVQDTWGYVLLRFAKSARDLEQAKALFQNAIDNPEAERVTKRLATAHLKQANDELVGNKGR